MIFVLEGKPIMNKILSKCPVCGGDLAVTKLFCIHCNTSIEGHFVPEINPFRNLSADQMQFLLTFVKCEGRLNRMEEEMKLSYPTLRNRLTDIVRALGFEPGKDDIPQSLSVEERRQILEDLDTGKIGWEEAQARLRGEKAHEDNISPSGEVEK
jgi:hypothetical protein